MNETLEQARERYALQEAKKPGDKGYVEPRPQQSDPRGPEYGHDEYASRMNSGDESEEALPDQKPQDQRLEEEDDNPFSLTAQADAATKKTEKTKSHVDHDAAFKAHARAILAHNQAERKAYENNDRLLARKHREQAQAHDDATDQHVEAMLDDPNYADYLANGGEEKVDEAKASLKIPGRDYNASEDVPIPGKDYNPNLDPPHINKYDQGEKQTGANSQYDAVKKKFTDGLIEEAAKEGEAECDGADEGKPAMTPADMGMLKGKKLKEFADNLQSATAPTSTTFFEAKASFAEGMKNLCKKGK